MAVIDVTFINAGDGAELDVELPDSMRAEQVIQNLINEGFIPPLNDNTRSYLLTIKGRNTIVEGQTLAEAGVISNDRIRVSVTPQRAGGWPELLTIAASIASIAQTALIVVDMWMRKAKEKNDNKPKANKVEAWNSVKQIRILMSDGNWVQLDSWISDPNKLKDFLNVFHVPSGSPKPIFVVFVLKDGSKVQLVASDDPVDRQQLDDFIRILKL